MRTTMQRTGLFALYQTTVLFGILLMPLALAVRRVGVRLPLGRLIDALREAYAAHAE